MDKEKDYLAAGITFLNRDDQTERAIVYPVTQVILMQRMHRENPEGRPWRTFVVGEDGWIEQQETING